jgi:hypothetical protein
MPLHQQQIDTANSKESKMLFLSSGISKSLVLARMVKQSTN